MVSSSPKAEGGSAFSPAGPNPAPRGNAAPSFIRSDFAGMDAAGPGASFGGGSPAGPVRGNRKRVRKVSEFDPSSYGKGFENRHVLTLGQDEEGETPTAHGQDSSSQIMSILRRRREGEQAITQAKTPPQTTVTPPPGMPTLRTPDGRTPRNLLESTQALSAWRQAQEAATPTTQPNGIQPAVFRPGRQPGGLGQDGVQTAPFLPEIQGDLPGGEATKVVAPAIPAWFLLAPLAAGAAAWAMQRGQNSMDAAEPLPPLPPSEAQKGGPTSFPGLDPDQGRADSASRPLITPVPQESMPTTTGGYGEEEIPPLITVTMDDGSEGYELPGGVRVIKSDSARANDRFDAARRKLYGRPSGEAAAKVLGGSRITSADDVRRLSAELSKPGGAKEADADLETFVQDTGGSASDIKTYPNGARVYNAPDGTRITRRDVSNEKYATNELVIARPGAKSDELEEVFKVRYGKEGK